MPVNLCCCLRHTVHTRNASNAISCVGSQLCVCLISYNFLGYSASTAQADTNIGNCNCCYSPFRNAANPPSCRIFSFSAIQPHPMDSNRSPPASMQQTWYGSLGSFSSAARESTSEPAPTPCCYRYYHQPNFWELSLNRCARALCDTPAVCCARSRIDQTTSVSAERWLPEAASHRGWSKDCEGT